MAPKRSASAFLLVGEDEIARGERTLELIDECLDPASRDFNLDRLSARDADPSAVATLLQTPPLMGSSRVVLLTEADAASAAVERVVGDFLRDPSPTTRLVAVGASRPAREPWTSFRKLGIEETFDPPKGAAGVRRRVKELVRRAGKEIEDEAAAMLADLHSDGSPAVLQDVAKAVAHAGERERVSAADVEAVTVSSLDADRYVFVELVGMGRSAEAIAQLHALLESGESPIYLVTLLTTHFLTLGGVRACEARGERTSAAIAAALHKPAYILDRRNYRVKDHEPIRVQARHYDREAIDRWLAGLLQLDLALKSSRLPEQAVMEEGILRLMTPPRAAA